MLWLLKFTIMWLVQYTHIHLTNSNNNLHISRHTIPDTTKAKWVKNLSSKLLMGAQEYPIARGPNLLLCHYTLLKESKLLQWKRHAKSFHTKLAEELGVKSPLRQHHQRRGQDLEGTQTWQIQSYTHSEQMGGNGGTRQTELYQSTTDLLGQGTHPVHHW